MEGGWRRESGWVLGYIGIANAFMALTGDRMEKEPQGCYCEPCGVPLECGSGVRYRTGGFQVNVFYRVHIKGLAQTENSPWMRISLGCLVGPGFEGGLVESSHLFLTQFYRYRLQCARRRLKAPFCSAGSVREHRIFNRRRFSRQ